MNDQTKPLTPTANFEQLSALPNFNELRLHPMLDEDPMMNVAEATALRTSIQASGIREPITLFRDQGKLWILDGRNRIKEGQAAGHRWVLSDFRVFVGSIADARRLAAELNDIRRHLSMDQRKAKAHKLIAENPSLSSRALAAMCGVSHTLIAEMRKEASEDDKRYSAFTRVWASLSLAHQERFVHEHRVDLAEFLRGVA